MLFGFRVVDARTALTFYGYCSAGIHSETIFPTMLLVVGEVIVLVPTTWKI